MDLTKPYQNIQYKVGATNRQLQRAIEAAVPAAVAQMKGKSDQFRGVTQKETARKIFDFLKTQITYKVDGDNQKIKLPSAFLRERSGDCKSYSLFTAAVLSNLGIPYRFAYASYKPGDPTPEHIYVVTGDGTIIDAVWGKFNSEKKANYKFYKTMNISYISGIGKHKKTHSFKKPKNIGKLSGGPIGCDCKGGYMGIGRSGLDWWKAVYGSDYKSPWSWNEKHYNPVNAAVRQVLIWIVQKNAGGIANFLYRISPFNDTPVIDSNKKAQFQAAVALLDKEMAAKYGAGAGPASSTTAQIRQTTIVDAKGNRYTVNVAIDPKAQSNIALQEAYAKEYAAKYAALREKYWWIISAASNAQQQKAYRNFEVMYFDLGGDVDDINDAVKEGNTKTPVGKVFNYWLRKVSEKKDPGIGLGIRAMTDALLTGDKFQLGDPDVFNIKLAGTRIGVAEPASATATILAGGTGATIFTEKVILSIVSVSGWVIVEAIKVLSGGPTSTPQNTNDQGTYQDNPPASEMGLLSGSSGTMILVGAAAVGAYLLMGDSKK